MVKSPPSQLSIFDLPTLSDFTSVTSSPELADGAKHYTSRDGRLIVLSGQDLARASRSRSQERGLALTMHGTYGPTSIVLSPLGGPLSSWESKLQVRLGMVGSTEFELTWKKLATPGGQSIFRLSRSTPRTYGSGSIGSPSTSWPTPTKADGDGGHGMGTASATGKREDGSKITVSLPGVVKIVSTWPTPLQQDCRVPATPESAQREWGHSNLRGIAAVTTWPTPTSQDCARGVGTIRPQDTGIPLPQRVAQAIGTTTSGLPDQTGKPGALNPAFPCWLMGYPTGWDACAPTATPSSRKSQPK